jgi:predicted  nucleic acid-binding Zn-ribbon protein
MGRLSVAESQKRKGEPMSEENTGYQDADSTNPLPFEDFVRQHLAVLLKRVNNLQEQQNDLQSQVVSLREQQVKLQEEMIERFMQLSRQIKDLDKKMDVFIREQTYIKDDIRELREEKLTKI